MLVIPSLDIRNGKTVQRISSKNEYDYFYRDLSDNPVELCKLWRSENSKILHINDVDGEDNTANFNLISEILKCPEINIPIIFSSKASNISFFEEFLDIGIHKISLCESLITDPDGVRTLMTNYTSSRIYFYAIVDEGFISFRGIKSNVTLEEFVERLRDIGATRIIYTDKEWLGKMIPVNYEKLKNLSAMFQHSISLFCGVPEYQTLKNLQNMNILGLDSVILSKPLYENNFPCQEVWRIAETGNL